MKLDGREAELLGNLSVLDFLRILQRETLHPFGHVRAARDGGATTEGLKLDIRDDTVLADSNLELHHVAASEVELALKLGV
jgi:hypothetical protein